MSELDKSTGSRSTVGEAVCLLLGLAGEDELRVHIQTISGPVLRLEGVVYFSPPGEDLDSPWGKLGDEMPEEEGMLLRAGRHLHQITWMPHVGVVSRMQLTEEVGYVD